jgi:hypothetical protein
MFVVNITESALEDLSHFKKAEQNSILDAIELQLVATPLTPTRNRKPLRQMISLPGKCVSDHTGSFMTLMKQSSR